MEFHPSYHEKEERFRARAAALHEEESALRRRIRSEADLADFEEGREDLYREGYEEINASFEKLANEHALAVEQERKALTEKVYRGAGEKFSEHLTALASVPDETLPELMGTATRTGQEDLERAIAMTALERNHFGIFEEWAGRNPERGDALKHLRSLPDPDRLRTRTLAMRPFKADALSLEPTAEDLKQAAQEEADQDAARAAFFERPRRVFGSRIA